MRHEALHQCLALFRDFLQLRRKDERIPRGLHPFVGHTSPLVVVRACTRSFGSERLPPCDRARLINTPRRFRSQVNLFAAQSGLCVARFLLALSPYLEFRGRACATGSLMQPERNVLSRKRRRGTLIGNLSKKGKIPRVHTRGATT